MTITMTAAPTRLRPSPLFGAASMPAYGFISDPASRQLVMQAARSGPATAAAAMRRATAAPQEERIRFRDFPPSPRCSKVRAMLRFKGLAFEAVYPRLHRSWLELPVPGHSPVPALEIDGHVVADSRNSRQIARELDRLYSAQPLIPGEPRTQALCHALEEWADEAIHAATQHYLWLDRCHAGQAPTLFGDGLFGRASAAACLAYRHWIARHARGSRGAVHAGWSTAQIEAELRQHLLRADALLTDAPFLLGDRPWLCDFALFGQLTALLRARGSSALVREHPRLPAYVERIRAAGSTVFQPSSPQPMDPQPTSRP